MIDVKIDDVAWRGALPDAAVLAHSAARTAMESQAGAEGDIAILLTNDTALADLNGRFRGKPRPSNVLAFPAPPGAGALGDIAIAYGVSAAEAQEQGKSLDDHLQHLVVHGMLHLMGYDHEIEADAERMEALERELLSRIGVPDPYQDRGDQGDHVQHGQ